MARIYGEDNSYRVIKVCKSVLSISIKHCSIATVSSPCMCATVSLGDTHRFKQIGDMFIHIMTVLPAAISPTSRRACELAGNTMPVPSMIAIPGIVALTVTPCSAVNQKPESATTTHSATMRPPGIMFPICTTFDYYPYPVSTQ